MGRHIYVPKPRKKRDDPISKRSLLVLSSAIFRQARIQYLRRPVGSPAYVSLPFQSHLELSRRRSPSLFRFHVRGPVLRTKSSNPPGLTSLKMGPRDSTERNGNTHSNGRGKLKAKTTRSLFSTSLQDLTQEDIDVGIDAVRHVFKILCFMQAYQEEIDNVDMVYDVGINQQARIDELETMMTDLTVRKDQEMARLLDENDSYKADVHQLEWDREKLETEKASMDDTRMAIHSDMQRQKADRGSKETALGESCS